MLPTEISTLFTAMYITMEKLLVLVRHPFILYVHSWAHLMGNSSSNQDVHLWSFDMVTHLLTANSFSAFICTSQVIRILLLRCILRSGGEWLPGVLLLAVSLVASWSLVVLNAFIQVLVTCSIELSHIYTRFYLTLSYIPFVLYTVIKVLALTGEAFIYFEELRASANFCSPYLEIGQTDKWTSRYQ